MSEVGATGQPSQEIACSAEFRVVPIIRVHGANRVSIAFFSSRKGVPARLGHLNVRKKLFRLFFVVKALALRDAIALWLSVTCTRTGDDVSTLMMCRHLTK